MFYRKTFFWLSLFLVVIILSCSTSKKGILNKINAYFGYEVVEKLKFISFDDEQKVSTKLEINEKNEDVAKKKIDEMCKKLLLNLVIEDYKIVKIH